MRRDDIHHILVIGSGPIVIGQACEFDYSGNQAVQALKEEGYEVSLINPNPATVMTTPGLADHIFLEPLRKEYIERIFDQVGPDAILSTMGGQTALNLTMELEKEGLLKKYGVKVIGASAEAIERAEDRGKFKDIVTSLGYESARSGIAHSIDDAIEIRKSIPLPLIIRPSFTLGGMGGSIAEKEEPNQILEQEPPRTSPETKPPENSNPSRENLQPEPRHDSTPPVVQEKTGNSPSDETSDEDSSEESDDAVPGESGNQIDIGKILGKRKSVEELISEVRDIPIVNEIVRSFGGRLVDVHEIAEDPDSH